KPYFLRMGGITLGEADEQIGQCEGAGSNSYRSSDVKVLERLAADPYALDSRDIFVPMTIRLITPSDRSEWLRLLLGLHPELAEAAHVPSIDAYLSGNSVDELIPSAVFVAERPNSRLGGFLELSIRNYAEGCSGDT